MSQTPNAATVLEPRSPKRAKPVLTRRTLHYDEPEVQPVEPAQETPEEPEEPEEPVELAQREASEAPEAPQPAGPVESALGKRKQSPVHGVGSREFRAAVDEKFEFYQQMVSVALDALRRDVRALVTSAHRDGFLEGMLTCDETM
jgi:hypothetical protein